MGRPAPFLRGFDAVHGQDVEVAGTLRYELGLASSGLTLAAGYGSFGRLRFFAGVRPTDDAETFAGIEYVQGDGFGPPPRPMPTPTAP